MKKLAFILIAFLFGTSMIIKAQLSFTSNGQQINNLQGSDVEFGDFNKDGAIDAFVVNISSTSGNGHRVYLNDSTGYFTDNGQQLIDSEFNAYNAAVGDINNDGNLEVISSSTIWLNNGYGLFEPDSVGIDLASTNNWGVVENLADLNNDGYLDLFCITVDLTSSIKIYLNDSTGHFRNTGQMLGGGTMVKASLGDIDSDGDMDAITAGWKSNTVDPANGTSYCPNRIWLNDGNGNYTESSQIIDQGNRHIHDLKLGDINNDRKPDLVLGITSSPYIQTYINDSTGHFNTGQSFGNTWVSSFDLGDVNNDGSLDLLFVSGDCSVEPVPLPGQAWLNNGMGHFTDSQIRIGNDISSDVKLADLNNDNRLDAYVVNWGWDGEKQIGKPADIWLNKTIIINYFDQTPPGNKAEKFAPGIVSLPNRGEYILTFSTDYEECYIYTAYSSDYIEKDYCARRINNSWSNFTETPYFASFFSADGKKIFYEKEGDILTADDSTGGWRVPISLPSPINSTSYDDSYTETAEGVKYICSNRPGGLGKQYEIWRINPLTNQAENLGSIINSTPRNITPCIAPDESYLIYTQSNGNYEHLYISFNKGNAEWTEPINMDRSGATINTLFQTCPRLSPDGKYLFFNKHNPYFADSSDIYWVSTDIIDTLKTIAFTSSVEYPEVKNLISVYPNPVHDEIRIHATNTSLQVQNYQITDISGKTVKQDKLKTETINISELQKGLYLLSLHTNKGLITEKILIE